MVFAEYGWGLVCVGFLGAWREILCVGLRGERGFVEADGESVVLCNEVWLRAVVLSHGIDDSLAHAHSVVLAGRGHSTTVGPDGDTRRHQTASY